MEQSELRLAVKRVQEKGQRELAEANYKASLFVLQTDTGWYVRPLPPLLSCLVLPV